MKKNPKKNAKDAEPKSPENPNTALDATKNSTGQKPENEAAPSGTDLTDPTPPEGGAPPPTEQTRVQAVEQAITILASKQDQIIDYLKGNAQPQQPQPGQPQQPQQPGAQMSDDDKRMAAGILGGLFQGVMKEPDPYEGLVKQKVLTSLDLSNQFMAAFIKRVAEGKPL